MKCELSDILDNEIYDNQHDAVLAKINQRRRQIMIHSYIYYELNDNIVTDAQWSQWAKELVWLQQEFADISKEGVYYDQFRKFDASTGFDFEYPIEIKNRAAQLLAHKGEKA